MERVTEDEVYFCDIVLAEILAGARNQHEYRTSLAHISRSYTILPITPEACERFREILATTGLAQGIHISDYLIAATAIAHDCSLLTLNKKHFVGIKGLRLA